MAENKFCSDRRDLVCIETNRVLDSCRDRDCYENVKVHLTDFGQEIIEHTGNIRVKSAEIGWTYISVDPVQFNRGFYPVNIRFYICMKFEACVGGREQEFDGVAVVEKRVILFGGESSVSTYRSDEKSGCECQKNYGQKNLPTAVLEAVDPVILDIDIVRERDCTCQISCCCCADEVPDHVQARLGGSLCRHDGERVLLASVGIFSVVRIVRPCQYLVSATEYCVPDKECLEPDEKNPCSIFRSMQFPTNEFGCGGSAPVCPTEREKRCGCQ